MSDTPETRASLLVRIRDPRDGDAWQTFLALYEPLIRAFARQRGLQDADAADLTQTVLAAVSEAIRRLDYDPRRGTFRGWLLGVTRNQMLKLLARERRQPHGGDELLDEQIAPPEDTALWEQEYKRQRFRWASERVRGDVEAASWQAFWRTAVEGVSAADVAKELGLSVGAVYTAKSRVLDRLRKMIQRLEEE
jgi:RNA polymerase sigma-70 factor (ECF subfamily)